MQARLATNFIGIIVLCGCSHVSALTPPAAPAKLPTTSATLSFAPEEIIDAPDVAPEPAVSAEPELVTVDAPAPRTTACANVVHVGDSTSVGLMSPTFLPNADDRLGVRYEAVGVSNFIPEIAGARSMVETLRGVPNATTIATRTRDSGFSGCWVFALGTNDPANVSGDVAALSRRIDAMMKRTGDMPVLWSTSKTLVTRGPYQNAHMESWNRAMREACDRHPNMRVYDWASEVKDAWFLPDGIHPNSAGCKAKASGFAKALVSAFPSGAPPSATCFVRSTP